MDSNVIRTLIFKCAVDRQPNGVGVCQYLPQPKSIKCHNMSCFMSSTKRHLTVFCKAGLGLPLVVLTILMRFAEAPVQTRQVTQDLL